MRRKLPKRAKQLIRELKQYWADELRVSPGFQRHEHLLKIVKKLPSDFEPFGKRSSDIGGDDCSCGCRWFHVLDGHLRSDWGVCANPRSPRCGLLTWEHQGCRKFKLDPRWAFRDTPEGEKVLKRFKQARKELDRQ